MSQAAAGPDLRLRNHALLAVFALFVLASGVLTVRLMAVQPLGIDFAPIWTGLRLSLSGSLDQIYDFQRVTAEQAWLLGDGGKLRPFVYPPTATLLLAPFGALAFWPAYAALTGLSAAAFLSAAWRAFGWRAAVLALATPAVALVALAGQLTLLVGALIILGLVLRDRGWVSGVLFGLAACLKPQLLLLLPIALLADRNWRAIAGCAVTGLILCAVSTAVWGLGAWSDWLAALPRFTALVAADPGLLGEAITPTALAVRLGWSAPLQTAVLVLSLAAGVGVVWQVFRRTDDLAFRALSLFGAGLLSTPYAMQYELALLAPAVAALALRVDAKTWTLKFVALLLLTLIAPGQLALLGVLALSLPFGPTWRARQDSNLQPSA